MEVYGEWLAFGTSPKSQKQVLLKKYELGAQVCIYLGFGTA